MSAQKLSFFLRKQMHLQGLSNSQVALKAGISRQTWYGLLNADIKQAKISTLLQVAAVLKVPPLELFKIYFSEYEDLWSL
ncbi:MAG: XRE family transcriptional regulator [Thiothrix sp.]|nr:MAG: XRE family transcriptional regulator [Thiothrix sp.]